MAKRKPTRKPSRRKASRRKTPASRRRRKKGSRRWLRWMLLLLFGVGLAGSLYGLYLDQLVRVKFEGKRWAVPARVFARPLELYAGASLSADRFVEELGRLGYRKVRHPNTPGAYSRARERFLVRTRDFRFWDQQAPSQYLELRFNGSGISELRDAKSGESVPLFRLEPPQIGSIYPSHNEDRILVRRAELPVVLVNALLAVEDRSFYRHFGVDPKAIARAMWSNLRAGGVVQGGSTLTQQLVKNFYLSQERTLRRKLNEAAMALLLDYHYEKDEILEAYANEIYLGQDGQRAIHGFGLASRFYFSRPLAELDLPRIALLVGMVRGPSYYNPVRQPERAKTRRNLVLKLLYEQGVIEEDQLKAATKAPLGVAQKGKRWASGSGYPAFMDVVRDQLHRDYAEEDLNSEGLRIFTTLDPQVQYAAEKAVSGRLKALEKAHGLPKGKLETAAVVAGTDGGELKAVVGSRSAGYSGFNRALSSRRSIGSLIKPAVYLAALTKSQRYNLLTGIDDGPIEVHTQDGQIWVPENFDKESHGVVPLHTALAKSYNRATVRLGMGIGLRSVATTLKDLGIEQKVDLFPSLLLGAVALSPMDVTQMYQTLATGGFRAPLRAIREVTDAHGEPLNRYPLNVRQVADSAAVYLVDKTLQEVVAEGTGRSLSRWLPSNLALAGKTGTTDELRDSWFAGFSGDSVAVVWVGRDDNKPAGLTGSRGALQVWGDIMSRIDPAPLVLAMPDDVEMAWVESSTGLRADENCKGAFQFPFVRGSAPTVESSCMQKQNNFFWSLFK